MAELLRSPTDPKCQSAFVAPLVTQDRAIGLLILGLDNEQLEDFPLLMAFANQVAATIEICQLHTELQQQLAEMQSVLVVTRALVSEVGLNNLLEFIMTQAEHLTNARGAAVLLLSDDGQWLEVATPGESWLRLKAGSRLPVSESLPGLAIASQQVQISNHAQDDGRTVSVRALLQPTELHSLLCAPLVAQGKGLGVLLVWDKRKHPFTAHDSRLMSLFADQAALALDNAHLHAENRQLAVEQERRRLARELHDSVTQSIYSIAMAAQTSLKLLGQSGVNGEVRDPIEHILKFSGLALAEMRDLLNSLYPADLANKGLVEFLAQHCDMLRAQYSLAIGFTADQEPSLSMPRRQALYCIAREALWNVIKHAVATRVDVSLTSEDDQVVLSIVDDGVGFDPSTLTREEAMGLKTMQERAQLLGGTLKLQSKSGQGTRVAVRFPA
jgi:signal transduction histidine kinase